MKTAYTKQELPGLASILVTEMDKNAIMTLSGPLGAGKTSLVREMLRRRGVTQTVTSPTFSYVNTYTTADGQWVHHFDLYRLSSADEFCEAGFEEYLDDETALVIIEWPEVIADVLARGSRARRVLKCELGYDSETLAQRRLVLQ